MSMLSRRVVATVANKRITTICCAFSSSNGFVKQRSAYDEEMKKLRKTWQEEVKLKKEREEQQRKAERQRLILEKAMRLREKRKESLVRQERARKLREQALARYREKLARNQVIRGEREEVQQSRYTRLVADLEYERPAWITTSDNIDDKITGELFEKQATTGLVTRKSDNWRWQVLPMNLKRMMSPDYATNSASGDRSSDLEERLALRGQIKSAKKLMVQDFLDPMIATGEDRAKYKQIVDKFAAQFEDMEIFDYVDQYVDDVAAGDDGYASDNDSDDDEEDDIDGEDSDAVSEASIESALEPPVTDNKKK